MSRSKQPIFVELTPKTERALARMGYHQSKWVLKRETDKPYIGATKGTWFSLQSRDGKAMLWVMKSDDEDFVVRVVQ
jgi:hypothetical protein